MIPRSPPFMVDRRNQDNRHLLIGSSLIRGWFDTAFLLAFLLSAVVAGQGTQPVSSGGDRIEVVSPAGGRYRWLRSATALVGSYVPTFLCWSCGLRSRSTKSQVSVIVVIGDKLFVPDNPPGSRSFPAGRWGLGVDVYWNDKESFSTIVDAGRKVLF